MVNPSCISHSASVSSGFMTGKFDLAKKREAITGAGVLLEPLLIVIIVQDGQRAGWPLYWVIRGLIHCIASFRREAHLRNYMYKRLKFENYLDKSNIRTRAHVAPLFEIPKSDTKTFDKSILIKGGSAWNKLPAHTRNIASYNSFKIEQKKWLNSMIPN